MIVVAEILSRRINRNTRIAPCGDTDDDDYESGRGRSNSHSSKKQQQGGDYAVALTETSTGSPYSSPTPPPHRHSITATIAASPAGTPDFNHPNNRRKSGVVESTDSVEEGTYEGTYE